MATEALTPNKFARRNKRILATVGLIALAMIVGTAASVYQAVRATRAEHLAEARLEEAEVQRDAARSSEARADQARVESEQARLEAEQAREASDQARQESEEARRIAETVTEYLVHAFRSPDPQRDGRTITVADVLDRTVEGLQDQFIDQPLLKARLLQALGLSYRALGLYQEAVRLLQDSLEIRRRELSPEHPETLTTMNNLGESYRRVGRLEEALALLERTLELSKAKLGSDHPDEPTDGTTTVRPVMAEQLLRVNVKE